MQDIQIDPKEFNGCALFVHSILHRQWRAFHKMQLEYSDYFAGFCVYWLTYRDKYDPSRGSPMAFAKICAFSYMNRQQRKRKTASRELVDVSVNIPLDTDEQAIVDTWVGSRCMVTTVKGLADRVGLPEKTVTEILNGLVDKVAERRRVRKIVIS
jgi:hypothetical protein